MKNSDFIEHEHYTIIACT